MATIVATGFIPQSGPVDARYVISSISDLLDVLKPYVGMHLWVTDIAKLIIVRLLQSQTDSFGTKYSIKSYSYTTLVDFTNKAVVAGTYSLAVPQSAEDLAISNSSSITVKQYLTTITQQLLRLPLQILAISIANAMLYGSGGVSSGGGISDYIQLTNKPSINNVTIQGNLTAALLGLAQLSDIPQSLALLLSDSTHRLVTDTLKSTWSSKQDAITSDNKLNPLYISVDADHRFTTDTLKSTWSNKQDQITADNKLNPLYITVDADHRFTTDTLKSTWSSKQDAITSDSKLDASLINRLQLSGRDLTVGANQIRIPLSDSRDLATVQRALDIALLQALIFG